jgi:hypothetical protein
MIRAVCLRNGYRLVRQRPAGERKKNEQLLQVMEQRGTRVLLFELPYSAQLENSRSAKITREIVHAEFPDSDRWLRADFTGAELRWADGVHLDERSALIVT